MRKCGLLFNWVAVAVLLTCAVALVVEDNPARAAETFQVNTTADTDDGACEPLTSSKNCTLREAIDDANSATGPDVIGFDIPTTDPNCVSATRVCTISPTTGLPAITDPVTINGYTQRPCSSKPAPCSKPNTLAKGTNAVLLVELNGSNLAGGVAGLDIRASNCLVKGLVINRFSSSAFYLLADTGTRIEGNFIGTDPSGTLASANLDGVAFANPLNTSNILGGTAPAARNLISANTNDAVTLLGSNNRVEGNLIGTRRDGSSPLGNGGDGVGIYGPETQNGPGSNNTIGGADGSAANTIAFNGGDGVRVNGGVGNRILRNSIFSNSELGIDLGNDGSTANDTDDPDPGANELQNYPVLTSARRSSTGTTIRGNLNSTPGKTFRIQFFANPSGTDEGKTFVGQKKVTTGASGDVTFTFRTARSPGVGQAVTATATDPDGNTSEFSGARAVVKG